MARVRGVTARSTAAGSRLYVTGSMSTNTGVAPVSAMVVPEATNENAEVMTSSPAFTPSARRARRSASVPELTPTPCRAPEASASSASSARPSGPMMNHAEVSTRSAAARSSSARAACCRLRSICGTRMAVLTTRSSSQHRAGAEARAGLAEAEQVHGEAELVFAPVPVDVLEEDRPALKVDVHPHPILHFRAVEDVVLGGGADVHVRAHFGQDGSVDSVERRADFVEARARGHHKEVPVVGEDVGVGGAEPQ